MNPIGTAVFLLGTFSMFIGVILLVIGIKSSGRMETEWGKFSGPVWFIFIAFGIVLQVVGVISPI